MLPVWLLLAPRDYLSTFLKIGTFIGLAISIIIARPTLQMLALPNLFTVADQYGLVNYFLSSLLPSPVVPFRAFML